MLETRAVTNHTLCSKSIPPVQGGVAHCFSDFNLIDFSNTNLFNITFLIPDMGKKVVMKCFGKEVKKAQVSFEYIVIMGFVTAVIIAILGVSFVYSSSIKDRIKMIQVSNFGNKIISSSESVFYLGEPSKITIKAYLPDEIQNVEIIDDSLVISLQLNSGFTKIAFVSEVPIEGSLSNSYGLKNIRLVSDEDKININDG